MLSLASSEFVWPVHDVVLDRTIAPSIQKQIEKEFEEHFSETPLEGRPNHWDINKPIIRTAEPVLHLKEAKPITEYNPFQVEELLFDFLSVDPSEDEQILNFVKKRGFIYPINQVEACYMTTDGDLDTHPIPNDALYSYESLDKISHQFNMINSLLMTYFDTKEKRNSLDEVFLSHLLPPDDLSLAFFFIHEINGHLRNISPRLLYDKGVLAAGYEVRTLLDVILLQTLEVISGTRNLGRCGDYQCQKYFIPERHAQGYCTPECSARARARTTYRKNTRDQMLIRFAEKSGRSWQDKLSRWNQKYPDIDFASIPEMKAAYKEALQKRGEQDN